MKKDYIFLFFLIKCFSFFACKNTPTAVENLPKNFEPYSEFRNIHSTYSEHAIIQLKREVPKLVRRNNGDEIYPEGIELELFNKQGTRTTILTADRGSYTQKTDIYQVIGNVVVTNTVQNQRLETPLLSWHGKKQKIYTDTVIKIITPDQVLNGIGLTANKDFSEYEIKEVTSEGENF